MIYLVISNFIALLIIIFLAKKYLACVYAKKTFHEIKDGCDHFETKVRERTDELLDISRKLHRSESQAFLAKLARKVTHEVRNPLSVLKNAAYFLNKNLREEKDEKVLKYIDMIEKEIARIDSMLSDFTGFARPKPLELREMDVNDVVETAISMVNVPERVEIKKEFEDLPAIYIDADRVTHAIVNITNNAIIAMKGNGILTVRTARKDDHACIEVADTGPGIPSDQRELVFEPLYSSKPKGVGLGLPMAGMMVESQGGSIELESEPGKGTVVRIFLPIKRKGYGQ